jgi:hypothetical protein
MKIILKLQIIFSLIFLGLNSFSQSACTIGPPSANDGCLNATLLTTSGVYCDNTCNFTANDASWFKNSGAFCGILSTQKQTVENNSFYKFAAQSNSINLTFCTLNGCQDASSEWGVSGIQVLIFNFATPTGTGTCGSGSINGYYCLKQLSGNDCSSCGNPKGCVNTTISSLTIGKYYYIMIDGYEGDCCGFSITYNSLLPLEILNLKGESVDNGNNLTWIANNEKNINKYEIERSFDNETWQKIGENNSLAKYATSQKYSFLDADVKNEITYYRLKQININGEYAFSTTISIDPKLFNKVSIAPNPFENELKININAKNSGMYSFSFISILGQKITKVFNLENGNNDISIETNSTLNPGFYTLEISDSFGNIIKTNKLLKIR